jgi:osmotically inducible lipoprotein OsmB
LSRGFGNWSGARVFEAEPLEDIMTRTAILTLTATAALALAACGTTVEQKAATGAVAGAVVAGPVGAAVGGAAGTAAAHVQKPN